MSVLRLSFETLLVAFALTLLILTFHRLSSTTYDSVVIILVSEWLEFGVGLYALTRWLV